MDATAPVPVGRRILMVVLATAMAMTLLPLLAEPASAAATYRPTPFACQNTTSGRTVYAYPPFMTSSTYDLQQVYWSPDLYRWQEGRWVLYNSSKPWFSGVANAYEVIYQHLRYGTWFNPNGTPINNSTAYTNLPRGYYAVKDYYRWGATQYYNPASFTLSAAAWVAYRTGTSYCYFS